MTDKEYILSRYPYAACIVRSDDDGPTYKIYDRGPSGMDGWIALSATYLTEKEAWADARKAIERRKAQ